MYTFDYPNRLIILDPGVVEVDTADMYSRWKDDVILSDNTKWLPALRAIGREPTVGSSFTPSYFFLLNGWKVRPHEADHELVVGLNLYSEDGSDPFEDTLGDFTVTITNRVSDTPLVEVTTEGSTVTSRGSNCCTRTVSIRRRNLNVYSKQTTKRVSVRRLVQVTSEVPRATVSVSRTLTVNTS